jgi:hypothetical protein
MAGHLISLQALSGLGSFASKFLVQLGIGQAIGGLSALLRLQDIPKGQKKRYLKAYARNAVSRQRLLDAPLLGAVQMDLMSRATHAANAALAAKSMPAVK